MRWSTILLLFLLLLIVLYFTGILGKRNTTPVQVLMTPPSNVVQQPGGIVTTNTGTGQVNTNTGTGTGTNYPDPTATNVGGNTIQPVLSGQDCRAVCRLNCGARCVVNVGKKCKAKKACWDDCQNLLCNFS